MCGTMGRSMKKYTKHTTENSWSYDSGSVEIELWKVDNEMVI